jgi:hypothetical protein
VAAQLKQELGVDAELIPGHQGEFTVWVDNAKVSEKHSARFPEPNDVVAAVRARAT